MRIDDRTLEAWIKEDVPYLDLTTQLLGVGRERGRLAYSARERTVVCGCEAAARVLEKLGARAGRSISAGSAVEPGALVLEAFGPASALHEAWRVCSRILEYASGIATRTRALVDSARSVNPDIAVLATRKCFPGTKELATEAAVAGGALPHRLGLSETVLIFEQHRLFMDRPLAEAIPDLKRRALEKKILAEASSVEDAVELCEAGIDGVQFDKLGPGELRDAVLRLRALRPDLVILAAGGITPENAGTYAGTGVDGLATSSIFFGRAADMKATMERA